MRTYHPTLSFCITCKNRFYQIQQTLAKNLEDNRSHKDIIEFVLVDFGSTDGLQEWIENNFMQEIEDGYLKYYYTEELKKWHMSIAKNTSHLLAQNEIVVNLDCDNYTGHDGGLFVISNMYKYGIHYTAIHQFSNIFGDGSCGRIALTKRNFLNIGGYDEGLEPAGYEDIDFLIRLKLSGLNWIHLGNKKYNKAIKNSKYDGVSASFENWKAMERRNFLLSTKNITSGKIIANTEQKHIGIIDNIYTF